MQFNEKYKESHIAMQKAMRDLKKIFEVESDTVAVSMLGDEVKRVEVYSVSLADIVVRLNLYGKEAKRYLDNEE